MLTLKNYDLNLVILQYNVQWSFNSFLFFFYFFLFFVYFLLLFCLFVFFNIENECEYVGGLGLDSVIQSLLKQGGNTAAPIACG